MKLLKKIIGVTLVVGMVACGGGGGNPGATANGSSVASTTSGTTGSTSLGDTQVTAVGSVSLELLSGAGVTTQSISAVEIAQVKATVLDAKSAPVSGTVVTFSEAGVGLLTFSPVSRTAMTNSQGVAIIELRAIDVTKIGATTVSVSAAVAKETITAVKNLEITNAPVTGGVVVDPQTLASAINFVSTDPADKAIVLQGAGGNGRTETGILRFRVVDKNGTPVKGVTVDFVVNPSADVTLNIPQGKTDGEGVVVTSVSSKTVATAVVVKATVAGKLISSQSDQLKVTTGLGVAAGFEILPLVYNLDGALSGDSTSVTARLVDANSNPVADGVPVVMVASGGKIGTSSAGGCNTTNGACSVTFEVQEPRPSNGLVTVTGSAKVGEVTTLLGQVKINMSSASIGFYEPAFGIPATPLNPLAPIALIGCNKKSVSAMVANALGYSAPAGTTLTVQKDTATGLGATIPSGNIVPDEPRFNPTYFGLVIDPTTADNPPCNPEGIASSTGVIELSAEAPKSKRKTKSFLSVTYPSGALKLVEFGTDAEIPTISQSCTARTKQIEAIGSNNLALPAGSTFAVSSTDSAAVVTVSTLAPPANSVTLANPSSSTSRESIWLTVTPPNSGVKPCADVGSGVSATFTVRVTITSTNGQRNTQTVPVTYPVAK